MYTEGPLAEEPPSSAADIRFILSGKFVEANKCLKGVCRRPPNEGERAGGRMCS
jgi:hypothetical protein